MKESSVNKRKNKNRSHTGLVIELKKHAVLFKHNVKKDIVYLNTLISYMYYIHIVKGAACYFENYNFKILHNLKRFTAPPETHFTTAYYKEALV